MAVSEQDLLIKEEPEEQDFIELKRISPEIGNLEIEGIGPYVRDRPEFVTLENVSNSYNSAEWSSDVLRRTASPSAGTELSKVNSSSRNAGFDPKEAAILPAEADLLLPRGVLDGNSSNFSEVLSNTTNNTETLPEDNEQDTNHEYDLAASHDSKTDDDSYNSSDDEDDDEESKCNVCKKQFLDEFELQNHYKDRRLAEKSYRCCSCGKLFRDNTQLNVHSRKHTGEQPYSCKICEKKFSVNGNLSKHMRIHTGERRFECDTCERKFTQYAHLEDHMKIHSGDKPYVCDFCNSAFKTKARMRKHKKSHDDDRITARSVPCPVCYKILKSTKQLVAHLETHDEGPENPFPCDICGKSYKNLFALNYHIKVHGGIKDFKCNLCDKAFSNASHLRRHMNSHSGVRPFSCNICSRGFPSQQNLKRHLMTHTGEKPFTCTECNRSFLTLENLNRHKRTHTGEKPFPCNICGKFFAHSTTAKEHVRVHTGDKPFGCSICGKNFSLNKALYKHIREKHPDFFPEFKRLNDLPPNMRRAREKIKREMMTVEDVDVKYFPVSDIKTDIKDIALGANTISDIKVDRGAEHEPNEVFIKVEKVEYDEDS